MNNQQTIGRIQEWRENATKTGKALPLKDLPLVFFGINVATLSAKEWFTIGANKTQAKQFDKLLKDKAKEGKNGGGLIEQVPIMLQLLHDNDTHSASGVNQLQLDLGLTRQELIETFRREQKEGKPITKRDRSLIDLGIDIALGITFNWFAVGGVGVKIAATGNEMIYEGMAHTLSDLGHASTIDLVLLPVMFVGWLLVQLFALVLGVFSPNIHTVRLHFVEWMMQFYEGRGLPVEACGV